MCLFEVIAKNFFVAERAVVFCIDAILPTHKRDMQSRASAFEQSVVDRLAYQVVVEAETRVGVAGLGRLDEVLVVQ